MANNNDRFDLSPYLIHFFRRIEISERNGPPLPEHWGFGNMEPEEDQIPPLFLLRCAIRHARLWATWSIRRGTRTIYGDAPAVCFTEMPISAFLEAGAARWMRGENMSPYGIVFPKKKLYAMGANPVIYGLDDRSAGLPFGRDGEERIIPIELLPLREQYRYVAYNPGSTHRVDWTHEREWRLPYRDSYEKFEQEVADFGLPRDVTSSPGFSFAGSDLEGMGVIVGSAKEVHEVSYDILTLVDRGVVGAAQFSFILQTDALPAPAELREPASVRTAIARAHIDLSPYFRTDSEMADGMHHCFSEIAEQVEAEASEPARGEPGGCWLWLSDNTHSLTRALLFCNRIMVNKEGRYLVNLEEFNSGRGLRQREEMTKQLAVLIKEEFDIECTYFSVLGSKDPDTVPFYTDLDFSWAFYNPTHEDG